MAVIVLKPQILKVTTLFSGTIHDYEPHQKIMRTFEMLGTSFTVQLEF